jgi:hypothetical protein
MRRCREELAMLDKDIKVSASNSGTGAVLTYTGPSQEITQRAAEWGKASIDYMRSPTISQHAFQRSDGLWQASVTYYGLD